MHGVVGSMGVRALTCQLRTVVFLKRVRFFNIFLGVETYPFVECPGFILQLIKFSRCLR